MATGQSETLKQFQELAAAVLRVTERLERLVERQEHLVERADAAGGASVRRAARWANLALDRAARSASPNATRTGLGQ